MRKKERTFRYVLGFTVCNAYLASETKKKRFSTVLAIFFVIDQNLIIRNLFDLRGYDFQHRL